MIRYRVIWKSPVQKEASTSFTPVYSQGEGKKTAVLQFLHLTHFLGVREITPNARQNLFYPRTQPAVYQIPGSSNGSPTQRGKETTACKGRYSIH